MTEWEKVIVDKLMKEIAIMFYTRYVDDNLLNNQEKRYELCFKTV